MAQGFSSSASTDVNAQVAQILQHYGGSDDTRGSFNRPRYNRWLSVNNSRDLGRIDNFSALITGTIGAQSGGNTLFFKVTLSGPADLRINKLSVNQRSDQYISVGVLDQDRRPLGLSSNGTALAGSDVVGTEADESRNRFQAGTYWFTITSSQWQSLPYAALLEVLRYKEIAGEIQLQVLPSLRLALVKLEGWASGLAPCHGALAPSATLRRLGGSAGGTLAPALSLAIPRGAAIGTMPMSGKLKATWRVAGAASGSGGLGGRLTVTRAGFGGGGGPY